MRDKVAAAIRELPENADPPIVEKADADAEPILFLSARSAERSIVDVNDWVDRVVRERVQTIPGVSSVRILGEKRQAMRLWMDPARLAVFGRAVTPETRLHDGDRIEILRPLLADPKTARRKRAETAAKLSRR